MNSKSLTIRFFTLVFVIALSVCHGSSIKSDILKIDFTNPKEARKKALWFPADKLNVTKQGLGRDGEAAESRPGEIQTKPIALGHSWRTPPNIYVRVTILPPPKAILLNDGSKSTSYPGNVFVRYSPDLKNWSSWNILEHSYRKSSDKKKRNERCYEGRISVTQRNRNEYYELLDKYSKLNVPWKSDEEAAVRWILKQQPKFFSKNIPFIGYVEFLFESNFYGGQRIKSFKADVSYCIPGEHYPPPQNSTYNKRSAIPWRFKAKHSDNPAKAITITYNINRPKPGDIKEFVADLRLGRYSSSHFKNFKITQKDIENILKNYHAIDEAHWRHGYSHMGGEDRTGYLILKNEKKVEWLVRPGGLATLKLHNGKMIYLAKELTPWKKKIKQKDAIDKAKQLSLTITTRNGFIDGIVKNISNKDIKILELFGYCGVTSVFYKIGGRWLEAPIKRKVFTRGYFPSAILKPKEKRKFTFAINEYSFPENIRENIKVRIVTNDIWSNIIKIRNPNKKIQESYPILKRLRLVEFRETLLPFLLKSGTKYKVGDSIRFGKTLYKIVKIIPKYEELRRGGSIVKLDKSKILLKSEDGKYTITMQAGKPVYSPRPKAVIEDIATQKMYHVGVDDTIAMYLYPKPRVSKKSGRKLKRKIFKYKVISVDRQKKQVIVEYKNKKIVIESNSSKLVR